MLESFYKSEVSFTERCKTFFSKIISTKTLSVLPLLLILAALPFTVNLSQKKQIIQQHADSGSGNSCVQYSYGVTNGDPCDEFTCKADEKCLSTIYSDGHYHGYSCCKVPPSKENDDHHPPEDSDKQTPDVCANIRCGEGYYCGGACGAGGDTNTRFYCDSAHHMTGSETCSNGCQYVPYGTDYCKGSSSGGGSGGGNNNDTRKDPPSKTAVASVIGAGSSTLNQVLTYTIVDNVVSGEDRYTSLWYVPSKDLNNWRTKGTQAFIRHGCEQGSQQGSNCTQTGYVVPKTSEPYSVFPVIWGANGNGGSIICAGVSGYTRCGDHDQLTLSVGLPSSAYFNSYIFPFVSVNQTITYNIQGKNISQSGAGLAIYYTATTNTSHWTQLNFSGYNGHTRECGLSNPDCVLTGQFSIPTPGQYYVVVTILDHNGKPTCAGHASLSSVRCINNGQDLATITVSGSYPAYFSQPLPTSVGINQTISYTIQGNNLTANGTGLSLYYAPTTNTTKWTQVNFSGYNGHTKVCGSANPNCVLDGGFSINIPGQYYVVAAILDHSGKPICAGHAGLSSTRCASNGTDQAVVTVK